jgi:hypothetical protein
MSTDEDKARREALLDKDLQELFREETAAMDPNEGLERFMAAVAAEPRRRASWWQRLNGWLGGIGFSPALASGVAVVQLGVIAALLATHASVRDESPESLYRGGAVQAQETPDFKITINPDADFSSLATLLRANQCRIVAGPSELGEIWIVVDDKTSLVAIRKSLEESSLIDDVAARQ